MIWDNKISFEEFYRRVRGWYEEHPENITDAPIEAQFALDLIFKTLIDDKENYEYLTTIPESTEQINGLMLDLILSKYSRKYRKFKKKNR